MVQGKMNYADVSKFNLLAVNYDPESAEIANIAESKACWSFSRFIFFSLLILSSRHVSPFLSSGDDSVASIPSLNDLDDHPLMVFGSPEHPHPYGH